MVDPGIAGNDTARSSGQSLERHLAVYTGLANRASPSCPAGLWTLVAWIHWRRGDRQSAWPALHLALELSNDVDAAHYLAVFMYDWVDPRRVPPVRLRWPHREPDR